MSKDLLYHFNDLKYTGVILSPRAFKKREQVEKHARILAKYGCSLLFDPCFYVPHTMRSSFYDYPYWGDSTYDTVDFLGQAGADFCRRVMEYQTQILKTTAIILPGTYTNTINESWLDMQHLFTETAQKMKTNLPIYATIALGPDIIMSNSSLQRILDHATNYPVDGIYLVYATPENEYLPTNSQFLLHLLSACLTLSLAGKDIIIGYGNQSALIFAAAGVKTIASGNFRNARLFQTQTFEESLPIAIKRKTWYYDGQSLSEFLPEFLGIAYDSQGMRGMFGPSTPFIEEFLSSNDPGGFPLQEGDAFKHYLTILRKQWLQFIDFPVNDRVLYVDDFFTKVNESIISYEQRGFALGPKSFTACFQAVQYALAGFMQTEGDRIDML